MVITTRIDPNEKALTESKKIFKERINSKDKKIISAYKKINELPEKIEVAIISTTADVRKEVVEDLLFISNVNHIILEKVIFQNSKSFGFILDILNKKKTKTWVNFPRRYFDFYKNIKREISGEKLYIEVIGNDWGLACNTIHFIDLFYYLTDSSNFKYNIEGLKKKIFHSKRKNFKEIKGVLKIINDKGDELILNDESKLNEELQIIISTPSFSYKIMESRRSMHKYEFDKLIAQEKIDVHYQSELSGMIIDEIIDNDKCELTPYEICLPYHKSMIDCFQDHFSNVYGAKIYKCPIT